MRSTRQIVDPDYYDFDATGAPGVGEAKPRDMTNHEKAELRRREAKRVPIGFQLPKTARRK